MTNFQLNIPNGIGQEIVNSAAMFECPLLPKSSFIKQCEKHGLQINLARLNNLEMLDLFSPVFIVRKSANTSVILTIPSEDTAMWFDEGRAIDTSVTMDDQSIEQSTGEAHESYYSIFQIFHLHYLLSALTQQFNMEDFFLDSPNNSANWNDMMSRFHSTSEATVEALRTSKNEKCVPLLCQYISNRYYPQTQTDLRQIRHKTSFSSNDQFITVSGPDYDWRDFAKNWDANITSNLFGLTKQKLSHSYIGLSQDQRHCDPLEKWWQLTQFISVDERKKLKGEALRAELMRSAANMLRLLYKELYDEDLENPNEIGLMGTALSSDEDRQDPLRYLEFVVNRFNINPKPKAVLIVEGPSEEAAIRIIFEKYYGLYSSVCGIEIIDIGGVDNATGGKNAFYGGLLRLIDYLHFHQTFVFVILDNENKVSKLEDNAKRAKSIHYPKKFLTVPEYIRIWDSAFELDNYTCEELAEALNNQSEREDLFSEADMRAASIQPNPMNEIARIYKEKTTYGLNKPKLNEFLANLMIDRSSNEEISKRPIIKILDEFRTLAAQNHQPITSDIKNKNQESGYFGKTYQP